MQKFNAPLYLPKGTITAILFLVASLTFATMLVIDFWKTGTVDSSLAVANTLLPMVYTVKRSLESAPAVTDAQKVEEPVDVNIRTTE